MQFEGDWAGVFIRGDDAAHFAHTLREILEENRGAYTPMQLGLLESLADQLEECEGVDGEQRLKPYTECQSK